MLSALALLLTTMTLTPTALASAPAPDAFPRLSDNTAGSATLEVRKVLHGSVDGMFVVPRNRQVVVAAGRYLWKFSDQGVLRDTLRVDGTLFMSGVMFEPDHFVDWVFTGSAQRKAYGAAVDGNALSHADVVVALQRADVVEFGKTDTTAWAYVWANGQAHKMDLTRHREQVDTHCHRSTHSSRSVRWLSACFEGLPPAPRAWTEVDPDSFAGFGDPDARVDVVKFDRRRYHLEEGLGGQLVGATAGMVLKAMGMPGSLPGRYWFGDAHTRLRVGAEVVQFKAFVPYEDGEYHFMHNMRWWEPAETLPGASPWFSVHPRGYLHHKGEAELLRHYEKDIGLYVVRPRGAADVPAAQRTVPPWRPVFEGPVTRYAAVTGKVEFAAAQPQASSAQAVTTLPAAHVWLRSPPSSPHVVDGPPPVPVDALWPALHQLPAALTVAWGLPSQEHDYTVLRVELASAETQEVMRRLLAAGADPMKLADATRARANRGRKEAAASDPQEWELVLRVPDLKAPLDKGQVLLRRGSRQLPLLQARLTYVVQPVERAARAAPSTTTAPPAPSTQPQRQQLQAAVASATQNARTGLPPLLQQAQAMVQDTPAVASALAPHVTAAYAELLNHYNRAGDFASSAALVRHYLAQVHPHIGSHTTRDPSVAYNQGVIASQTLAFAIHAPQQRDLADTVIATLIGPTFDPLLQTNGTLMYNLACYYAVHGDKPRLLQSTAAARRLGKHPSQFMADKDFERYWQDAEFLQALQ
ncbi:MAG: hypothetical protein KKH21_05475 [Gammaproteobacteria bacterium]|nr:hypothetical protein [Gammaproteobacteria bacterium]